MSFKFRRINGAEPRESICNLFVYLIINLFIYFWFFVLYNEINVLFLWSRNATIVEENILSGELCVDIYKRLTPHNYRELRFPNLSLVCFILYKKWFLNLILGVDILFSFYRFAVFVGNDMRGAEVIPCTWNENILEKLQLNAR